LTFSSETVIIYIVIKNYIKEKELKNMAKFGLWTSTKKELPPEPEVGCGVKYLCLVCQNQVIAMRYVHRGATTRLKDRCVWEWQGRNSHWQVIAWMPFPVVNDFMTEELTAGNNLSAI